MVASMYRIGFPWAYVYSRTLLTPIRLEAYAIMRRTSRRQGRQDRRVTAKMAQLQVILRMRFVGRKLGITVDMRSK